MKFLLVSLLLAVLAGPALQAQAPAKPPKTPSAGLQALTDTLSATQTTRLMSILNRGDNLALENLPGIGPARGTTIQRVRPFDSPLDLLRVSGIGEATLAGILNYARAGFIKRDKGGRPSAK